MRTQQEVRAIVDELCGSLSSVFPSDRIDAIIFGSYAELLMSYGIVVSPIVENRDYFNSNSEVLPLYRNIRREGCSSVPELTNTDLSVYRLQKAGEMLASAKRDMAARIYCIFYAMRAVLALDGEDYKKALRRYCEIHPE